MSDTKPREFWILMAEQDDILLTPPSRIKSEDKYIHVIEHSAYESLKAERDELKRKLDVAREALKKINQEEINSQRPGGGNSISAILSYAALNKIGDIT